MVLLRSLYDLIRMETPLSDMYFTQKEAARYLRLSVRTLERHRVTGTGPSFIRIGRRVVYSVEELDSFATSRTFTSTSEADAAEDGGNKLH